MTTDDFVFESFAFTCVERDANKTEQTDTVVRDVHDRIFLSCVVWFFSCVHSLIAHRL